MCICTWFEVMFARLSFQSSCEMRLFFVRTSIRRISSTLYLYKVKISKQNQWWLVITFIYFYHTTYMYYDTNCNFLIKLTQFNFQILEKIVVPTNSNILLVLYVLMSGLKFFNMFLPEKKMFLFSVHFEKTKMIGFSLFNLTL